MSKTPASRSRFCSTMSDSRSLPSRSVTGTARTPPRGQEGAEHPSRPIMPRAKTHELLEKAPARLGLAGWLLQAFQDARPMRIERRKDVWRNPRLPRLGQPLGRAIKSITPASSKVAEASGLLEEAAKLPVRRPGNNDGRHVEGRS